MSAVSPILRNLFQFVYFILFRNMKNISVCYFCPFKDKELYFEILPDVRIEDEKCQSI